VHRGVFFVTRQRSNAKYRVIQRSPVDRSGGVTSDQIIRYTSDRSRKKRLPDVRRVGYYDAITRKQYYFITHHTKLSAKTIADIYKQRWHIELFFKWIKQNLKIKAFLGTTKNAVMTQIWIALCVYLLLAYLKFASQLSGLLQQIRRLLQLNLFQKCNLIALLKAEKPPPNFNPYQICMTL
jgi:putative transposase